MLLKLCRTTDMEGSHGQLRTRFTDGLGGNNADCFTDIDKMTVGKIPTIAHGTDAMLGLAGENGADIDPFDTGAVNSFRQGFVDLLHWHGPEFLP